MSRKMINYCENVHESTSLSGVSVWWLKIGFWLWQKESVSVYNDSLESVLKNWLSSTLKLDELALRRDPFQTKINQPPFPISNPSL